MASARLLSIELERFKSYRDATTIDLSPLTVVIGRNNSGKSTLIQALLLLKQTLLHPQVEVPLHLEGFVDALNLRELTWGRPASMEGEGGPRICLRWSSVVDMQRAIEEARDPHRETLAERAGVTIPKATAPVEVTTTLDLSWHEGDDGRLVLLNARATSEPSRLATDGFGLEIERHVDQEDVYVSVFSRGPRYARHLLPARDRFLPFVAIDRRKVGPRDTQRSWYNAFLILLAQPLEDLRTLLSELSYLGSTRAMPPTLYRASTAPPEGIGVSGEYAAQMLRARQNDVVHYLRPLDLDANADTPPRAIRARPLAFAVNDVFRGLGVDASVSVSDVKEFGFRLLFGGAAAQHVGRGLSYLLPVVELGLLADPLRFTEERADASLEGYLDDCGRFPLCAFEEPESHLHPKVQSRLADWLVALAMSGRRLVVETHSDHLVRQLRRLASRARSGSELERWLLDNVTVLGVDQRDGCSTVTASRLTSDGSLGDHWPADFMDEATDAERAIYTASLDKEPTPGAAPPPPDATHDEGEEPDVPPVGA